MTNFPQDAITARAAIVASAAGLTAAPVLLTPPVQAAMPAQLMSLRGQRSLSASATSAAHIARWFEAVPRVPREGQRKA